MSAGQKPAAGDYSASYSGTQRKGHEIRDTHRLACAALAKRVAVRVVFHVYPANFQATFGERRAESVRDVQVVPFERKVWEPVRVPPIRVKHPRDGNADRGNFFPSRQAFDGAGYRAHNLRDAAALRRVLGLDILDFRQTPRRGLRHKRRYKGMAAEIYPYSHFTHPYTLNLISIMSPSLTL